MSKRAQVGSKKIIKRGFSEKKYMERAQEAPKKKSREVSAKKQYMERAQEAPRGISRQVSKKGGASAAGVAAPDEPSPTSSFGGFRGSEASETL